MIGFDRCSTGFNWCSIVAYMGTVTNLRNYLEPKRGGDNHFNTWQLRNMLKIRRSSEIEGENDNAHIGFPNLLYAIYKLSIVAYTSSRQSRQSRQHVSYMFKFVFVMPSVGLYRRSQSVARL